MAKIELKGTIRLVNQMEEIGENKTKKKSFIFDVKGYTDDFGEQKGRDQAWKIDVIGEDRIKRFLDVIGPVMEGVKGTAIVYVESTEVAPKGEMDKNGRQVPSTKPNMFIVNNNLAEFLIFTPKAKS